MSRLGPFEQAADLRSGSWAQLDVAHLADEIAALARAERHALTSALRVILLHMLKWDHQPERRTRSWVSSIRTQRLAATEQIEDSPSLVPQIPQLQIPQLQIPQLLARASRRARIEAAAETGLPDASFPKDCPYGFGEIMDRAFLWPADPDRP